MTILRHECRRGRKTVLIWTLSIAFFVAICVWMFPEIEKQMKDVTAMFSAMGAFTAAFGLDKLNMGTLIGFYAVECGNIMNIGGAFFAALIAIGALAREEEGHTAEFLLTHPVSRRKILTGKLLAIFVELIALNLACVLIAAGSILLIGHSIPWHDLGLLHLAYFLVQLVIAMICFGISAFLKNGAAGIGIGLAAMLYFLNIFANISNQAKICRYFTPFGFAEGADLLINGTMDWKLVAAGLSVGVLFVLAGFFYYEKKDITG